MTTRVQYGDIAEAIYDIADEINMILDNCREEQYLYGIILLYSFTENLLKWLVFVKLLWDKSMQVLPDNEIGKLQQYCKGLNFYNAQQIALAVGLVDWGLFSRVDTKRSERNDFIHQFWLHARRGDPSALRQRLESLATVANDLVGVFNDLTEEIGVDEAIEVFL